MGTNLSLKAQARMEDKVRIKNLKSLFVFLEKFGRVPITADVKKAILYYTGMRYNTLV